MPDLPDIERLQAIDLQPGDVLIATLAAGITPDAFDQVSECLKGEFPDQHVIVLAGFEGVTAYRPVPVDSACPYVSAHRCR